MLITVFGTGYSELAKAYRNLNVIMFLLNMLETLAWACLVGTDAVKLVNQIYLRIHIFSMQMVSTNRETKCRRVTLKA